MNLQQLRYLCGIVNAKFSISSAAKELHTSQPGISKQIQMLEEEIGIKVLIRNGNRIVGLTEPGKKVFTIAQRMMSDMSNLKLIGDEFSHKSTGQLSLGTTHAHAKYTLMPIINSFKEKNPKVHLEIRQGSPFEISNWVLQGEVDFGICAKLFEEQDSILCLPCGQLDRSIFVTNTSPLLTKKNITLRNLAEYPLLIIDRHLPGGADVLKAFEKEGITPQIFMSAIDSDVIKAYVELGHGIAILPTVTYEKSKDLGIQILDASHIFPSSQTNILILRDKYLRPNVMEFINMIQPDFNNEYLNRVMLNTDNNK